MLFSTLLILLLSFLKIFEFLLKLLVSFLHFIVHNSQFTMFFTFLTWFPIFHHFDDFHFFYFSHDPWRWLRNVIGLNCDVTLLYLLFLPCLFNGHLVNIICLKRTFLLQRVVKSSQWHMWRILIIN